MEPSASKPKRGLIYFCSALAAAVSLAVLYGWAADIETLKTVLPGYPQMKPAGAGGFLLLAIGLALSLADDEKHGFRWPPMVIGTVAALGGATVLVSYFFQISSRIDSSLIPNLDPSAAASRVSPISAVCFVLLGIAMAAVRSSRLSQLSGALVAIALVVTYAASLGHLYKAESFDGFSDLNGMPLQTAFLMLVIGTGLLWRNTEFYFIKLVSSSYLGGEAARYLIPAVVVIPTLIGWVRTIGQDNGLYDTGFGSAISIFTLVVMMLATVLGYSRTMNRADEKRRRAEGELAEKEMRYRELFDYSQGFICIHDLDGRLTTVNRAAQMLLGYSESELLGRSIGDLVAPDRRSHFDAYLRKVTNDGLADGLLELVSKSGKRVVLRYYNILATEAGKAPYILGHAQDVTELLDAQKKLKELSLKDDLTGLYNRRGFMTMAELQRKLERHSSTARGLTLMFADMDGLKAINDTYGHATGSEAIKTLGRLIASSVRSADLVARWGGDEFVILSIGAKDDNAQLVVDRILERIDVHNAESTDPYMISISIGSVPINDGHTLEEIIAKADEAMYAEKKRRQAERNISGRPFSYKPLPTEHTIST